MATDNNGFSAEKRKVPPPSRGYGPSRVIHVRNLPDDVDMEAVMELGRPFGTVISAMKIKDTQAFLFMEDLKCAEELVEEYKVHPPKIGWRTVFVQYSQYSRLDVSMGAKKAEPVESKHSRDSDSASESRSRRRSRDSHSRRSSSSESSSPPLPDISIPFYMLPRSDEPSNTPTSHQFTARPHLVSYPVLPKPGLVSYPCSQQPALGYPCPAGQSSQTLPPSSNAAALPSDCRDRDTLTTVTGSHKEPTSATIHSSNLPDLMSAPTHPPNGPPPPPSEPLQSRPPEYDNTLTSESCSASNYIAHVPTSDIHSSVPSQHWNAFCLETGDSLPNNQETNCPPAIEALNRVLDSISADLELHRRTCTVDYGDSRCDMRSELTGFSPQDVDLLMSLQQQFGPHSLPTIAAMFRALCRLSIDSLIAICHLVPSQLDPVTWNRLHGGANNILPLILQQLTDILHTRHRYETDANNRNSTLPTRFNEGNYVAVAGSDDTKTDGSRKKPKRRRFEPLNDET